MSDDALRAHLVRLLDWKDAHAAYDDAVDGIAPEMRGRQPEGLPYSPWQLVEHLRITQWDILEFCVNDGYVELEWPADYWPDGPEPPSAEAWDDSLRRYRADRDALKRLAAVQPDLLAAVPHGSGQTYLRELLLVADHSSYHVGQLVAVRRLLGIWPGA